VNPPPLLVQLKYLGRSLTRPLCVPSSSPWLRIDTRRPFGATTASVWVSLLSRFRSSARHPPSFGWILWGKAPFVTPRPSPYRVSTTSTRSFLPSTVRASCSAFPLLPPHRDSPCFNITRLSGGTPFHPFSFITSLPSHRFPFFPKLPPLRLYFCTECSGWMVMSFFFFSDEIFCGGRSELLRFFLLGPLAPMLN